MKLHSSLLSAILLVGKNFQLPIYLLALAGCSGITVHLYTQGMTSVKVEQVTDVLATAGYRVVINEMEIPAQILVPTLVYSSKQRSKRQLTDIRTQMFNLDYFLNLVPDPIGNNFYSRNNAGLFLVPYANLPLRPIEKQQDRSEELRYLEGKYFTGKCETYFATLYFLSAQQYTLSLYDWQASDDQYLQNEFTGNWQQQAERLILSGTKSRVAQAKSTPNAKSQKSAKLSDAVNGDMSQEQQSIWMKPDAIPARGLNFYIFITTPSESDDPLDLQLDASPRSKDDFKVINLAAVGSTQNSCHFSWNQNPAVLIND